MKITTVSVAATIASLWAVVSVAAGPSAQEANRKLVLDMWQAVIVQLDEAAVARYIAPDYVQHNPNIGQGREGLIAAIRRSRVPGAKPHSIKRLIASFAQDDLVVLVWDRDLPDPKNPGGIYTNNAFDMFRMKDAMVVEHWDDNHKNP